MKEPIIRLKNISFSYDEKVVLQNVNFEVYEGDRIGIIGQNGSGKTTLLYIIMGLVKSQSGSVEIFGKIRRKEKDFIEVRQKIGLLFQDSDSQLFCPTVKENIAFGPLNLGKTKQEAEKIVKETINILGIQSLENRAIYKLSGGEKRLVALATVIAMKPVCFLLDEPSTGLDEDSINKILNYLKNNSTTYVVVSHERNFIESVSEKIYILKNHSLNPFV